MVDKNTHLFNVASFDILGQIQSTAGINIIAKGLESWIRIHKRCIDHNNGQ